MQKDKCQKLFELVESIGEISNGDLHIFNSSEKNKDFEGDASYRVYHKDGYCFDVNKIANYNVETGEFIEWEYDFFTEWDGFEKIDEAKAIELLKNQTIKI